MLAAANATANLPALSEFKQRQSFERSAEMTGY